MNGSFLMKCEKGDPAPNWIIWAAWPEQWAADETSVCL